MAQSSNSSYEDLRVWQAAIELASKIYSVTLQFPKHQQFGLTSQLQRSAVSIASNIAEGCARNSHQEFIYFLGIASGSLAELITQITISNKIGFLSDKDYEDILAESKAIGRMLSALKRSIRDIKKNLTLLEPVTNNQ